MNRKRVQMLRNMMAGIPEKQVNLNHYYDKNGEPCGTIACIAGWAAIYPPFVNAGLHTAPDKWARGYKIIRFRACTGIGAAAKFFRVPRETFYPVNERDGRGTHKQIALRRLDRLLAARNEVTSEAEAI